MPSNFLSNVPFNPLMLPWTDLGLRTLEAMVATGQQVSEQVDRMTRATAGEPTEELTEELTEVTRETTQPLAASALATISQMQAAGFQWAMQAWQQWFNAFASFNPMRLGRSADEAEPTQPSLFNAMLSPLASVTPPKVSHARANRPARAARETMGLEHAAAESGKRRSSNRSKPRSGNSRAGRSKSH
jgi:hypothetical protein